MKRILKFLINTVAVALFLLFAVLTVLINVDMRSNFEKQAVRYVGYIREGNFKKAYNMLGNKDTLKYEDFEGDAKDIRRELKDSDGPMIVGSEERLSDELKSVYIRLIDEAGNIIYSNNVLFMNEDGKWKIQG